MSTTKAKKGSKKKKSKVQTHHSTPVMAVETARHPAARRPTARRLTARRLTARCLAARRPAIHNL